MEIEPFKNRVRKRAKHLRKSAKRWKTDAFRIYDRDMPEFPYAIDRYGDIVYLQTFLKKDREPRVASEIIEAAIREILMDNGDRLVTAVRQKGGTANRYTEGFETFETTVVSEGDLKFEVNVGAHVDTGLFCDHRNLRRHIGKTDGTGKRFLNLFAYTGSFSVWAAASGYATTTVDLSNTYLEWGKRNFEINGLDLSTHVFDRSDATRFLVDDDQLYDVIVIDPPSYSKSKKMVGDFEVQRDHTTLITKATRRMTQDGVLYFSNNLRTFKMSQAIAKVFNVTEISSWTQSEDFPNTTHRAWEIRRKETA